MFLRSSAKNGTVDQNDGEINGNGDGSSNEKRAKKSLSLKLTAKRKQIINSFLQEESLHPGRFGEFCGERWVQELIKKFETPTNIGSWTDNPDRIAVVNQWLEYPEIAEKIKEVKQIMKNEKVAFGSPPQLLGPYPRHSTDNPSVSSSQVQNQAFRHCDTRESSTSEAKPGSQKTVNAKVRNKHEAGWLESRSQKAHPKILSFTKAELITFLAKDPIKEDTADSNRLSSAGSPEKVSSVVDGMMNQFSNDVHAPQQKSGFLNETVEKMEELSGLLAELSLLEEKVKSQN